MAQRSRAPTSAIALPGRLPPGASPTDLARWADDVRRALDDVVAQIDGGAPRTRLRRVRRDPGGTLPSRKTDDSPAFGEMLIPDEPDNWRPAVHLGSSGFLKIALRRDIELTLEQLFVELAAVGVVLDAAAKARILDELDAPLV